MTPFTDTADGISEAINPPDPWPNFGKPADKVHSLNVSQARMINHQAQGSSLRPWSPSWLPRVSASCSWRYADHRSRFSRLMWNKLDTEQAVSRWRTSTWPCRMEARSLSAAFARTHHGTCGAVFPAIHIRC